MYQIRYSSGNEIQVIGRGEHGQCRVVGPHGAVKFTGGYAACRGWLAARACRPLHPGARVLKRAGQG